VAEPTVEARIRDLERRLDMDPSSRLFVSLAEEYRKIGRLRDALSALQKGLLAHPGYVAAQVALGRVYVEAKQTTDAIATFTKVLSADPGNLVAAKSLADVHLDRGDKLESLKKYKLYRALSGDRKVDGIIAELEPQVEPKPVTPLRKWSQPPPEPLPPPPSFQDTDKSRRRPPMRVPGAMPPPPMEDPFEITPLSFELGDDSGKPELHEGPFLVPTRDVAIAAPAAAKSSAPPPEVVGGPPPVIVPPAPPVIPPPPPLFMEAPPSAVTPPSVATVAAPLPAPTPIAAETDAVTRVIDAAALAAAQAPPPEVLAPVVASPAFEMPALATPPPEPVPAPPPAAASEAEIETVVAPAAALMASPVAPVEAEKSSGGNGSEEPAGPSGRALADLYYAQGHYAEALQIYDDLVNRNPFDEDLQRMRRDAEARLLPAGSSPAAAAADPALERRLARIRVLRSWLSSVQTG
jgi:tetratricopeptide (TPR) repeat protein